MSARHRWTSSATAGRAVALFVAVAALVAAGGFSLGADRPAVVVAETAPSPTPAAAPPAPTPTWTVTPVTPTTAVSPPVRVRIPAIGVDSRIVHIGVDAAGELIPPRSAAVTGWFTSGPRPGAIGPALLAGHVDSQAGPGVFFHLTQLRRRDVITVVRADRSSVSFVVESSTRVAKVAFPTELVYSPKPVAMLRLVTCGGTFDSSARSYRDNIIVNATIR